MKKLLLAIILFTHTYVYADASFDSAKKYCDAGVAEGCFNLGIINSEGKGVRQNDFKAVKLLKKSCKGGVAIGCFALGLMYVDGRGVRQSNAKAKEMFGKACDSGIADGCKNYAIMNKR